MNFKTTTVSFVLYLVTEIGEYLFFKRVFSHNIIFFSLLNYDWLRNVPINH